MSDIKSFELNTFDGLVEFAVTAIEQLQQERRNVSLDCVNMFVAITNELLERQNKPKLAPVYANCCICLTDCDGLAGNPAKWPVYLGNNRAAHMGCVNHLIETNKTK